MTLDLVQIRQKLYGSNNWVVVPFVAATHDYSTKEQSEQHGNIVVHEFNVTIKQSGNYTPKNLSSPSVFELLFDGVLVVLGSDEIPVRAVVETQNVPRLKITYKSIR